MSTEKISREDLREGRAMADNATTGVSKGHDKGFNEVKLHTTSPDKYPHGNAPESSSQRMHWFRRNFGEEDCGPFIDHFQRMWVDAGKPPEMVLLSENNRGMDVTLFARLPIDLDNWERLGDQDLPPDTCLLVGHASTWKAERA